MGFLAEEILDHLLHPRDARGATHQYDLVDVRGLLASVSQRLLGRLDRALDQVLDHLFQLGARQAHLQVLGAAGIGREERQIDLRLHDLGQLDLRLLGCLAQTL